MSSLPAGASGAADSASWPVPPPAGSGRVHASGSWRRGGRTRYHPDSAEPGHVAEQVGQPQHQDGRPQGKTVTGGECFITLSCPLFLLSLLVRDLLRLIILLLNLWTFQAKLDEAVSLATGFQTSLQDTINWLTQAEQTLNMAQPPSLMLDTVLFQIDEHKVLNVLLLQETCLKCLLYLD